MPLRKYPPTIRAEDWSDLIDFLGGETDGAVIPAVFSKPAQGKKKIVNLWWDQDTQEVIIETE